MMMFGYLLHHRYLLMKSLRNKHLLTLLCRNANFWFFPIIVREFENVVIEVANWDTSKLMKKLCDIDAHLYIQLNVRTSFYEGERYGGHCDHVNNHVHMLSATIKGKELDRETKIEVDHVPAVVKASSRSSMLLPLQFLSEPRGAVTFDGCIFCFAKDCLQ